MSPEALTLLYQGHPLLAPTKDRLTISSVAPAEGFLIVETSMKTYAFTVSPFLISIMSLFVRLDYKLPNMVAGIITRDSVRRIFVNELTSKDIVAWMKRVCLTT